MKKVLITLLLLAVAGGLFAQGFTISGTMDTIWVPFQAVSDEDNTMMGAAVGRDTNGGAGPRARLFGSAKNEDGTLGLDIQLQFFPYAGLGFDDNVKVWWQPIPEVRLVVGKYVESQLIGNEWDFWFRRFTVASYNSANTVFDRFDTDGGALLVLTPGDLTIGVNFDYGTKMGFSGYGNSLYGETNIWAGGSQGSLAPRYSDGVNEFGRVMQRTQVAVGYKIQDIGLARIQFRGANPSVGNYFTPTDKDGNPNAGYGYTSEIKAMKIEAAFRLQAVEGLDLDIGFKFPLPFNESAVKAWYKDDVKWDAVDDPAKVPEGTYQAPMVIGVGIIYTAGDFRLDGIITSNFGGKADLKDDGVYKMGPDLNVHFWPSYNIGPMSSLGNVTLGADLGFWWKGKAKFESADTAIAPDYEVENGIMVGGGLWAKFAYAGGSITAGLALSVPTKVGQKEESGKTVDVKAPMVFSIPILFGFSF